MRNKRLEITKSESSEAVEKRINTLNLALSKADRIADIIKAAEDAIISRNYSRIWIIRV